MEILDYIDRIEARYGNVLPKRKIPNPETSIQELATGGVATPKRGLVDGPGSYGGTGTTKSLGGGLMQTTYKQGSKTYHTSVYNRKTGKNVKTYFGPDKKAAVQSLKEQKADRPKTKFEKIKEVKETKGTKEFQKITDKIDKKFSKIESKGYTNLREFRDEMKNLVTKNIFRNQFEIQNKINEYITDKFKNIEDVNTSSMEKALDKYNRTGGKERGIINKIADEFGVNKNTFIQSIDKTGRKKIPIKYGDRYEKQKAAAKARLKAYDKFSNYSFENKMAGSPEVQKSHMDDLHSRVVTAETMGYAPKYINQEILTDVDAYLKALYEKRDKLIKNKPEGYKKAIEEINEKGIKVASATKGYKSFQIMQPDGSTYQFGVDASKTIDPTGITKGKQIKGNVQKVQFKPQTVITEQLEGPAKGKITSEKFGGKKATATLTPDPIDQYFFEKNRKAVMEAQSKVTKKEMKTLLAALSRKPKCKAGFFSGGRVGFKDGSVSLDQCAWDGAKVVNSGKFKSGAEARNVAKFLNSTYKMGKWVWKWGVIPEAVFAGGDALIRMGYGATLDEGLLRATDYLFSGNQTLKADVLEIERQLGGEAAEVFRNVGNWKDRKDELESIKQQRASDHTVAGTDFAETNSGMSSAEVDKYWDPIQTAKEKELRDASVSASKDEQILAESYLDEAYDKSDTDSLSSKIAFYKNQGAKPMSQVGTLPDKTQAELNKRMSPQNFTRDMLTREPEIYHQVMDNLKKDLYPHQYFWDEKENFENIKSDKGVSEAQGHYNLSLALLDQALKKPLSSHVLDDRYTKEQVYGTQEGRGFLEKLNRKKFIRPGVFNATSNQLDDIYDMGRQGAASGGIAGVRRPNAIAPESGPAPQGEGLSYLLNRVREW